MGLRAKSEHRSVQELAAVGAVLDRLIVAVHISAARDQLGDGIGDSEAVVEHGVRPQLAGGTPGDHLPGVKGERILWLERCTPWRPESGQGHVCALLVALRLARIDHHGVHHRARHPDGTGGQRTARRFGPRLCEDLSPAVASGDGQRKRIERGALFLQREVAV